MPDLLLVFAKRWKLILWVTVFATLIALIFALLSPKKYLSVATALPVNSVTADKARVFNQNIEALYSDFGTSDELDRLEGTGTLDTIFIAAANELNLPQHYSMSATGEGPFKAAMKLKKNTKISRSSYGELKVKVWDEDRNLSAAIANFLMEQIQELHQHLQNESNVLVLEKIKSEYAALQNDYLAIADSLQNPKLDTVNARFASAKNVLMKNRMAALADQLQEYQKMIAQYQLAVSTNAQVLLVVENARPPLWPDKPKVLATVLFTFFGALLFSFLLSLFVESRKAQV
jgi:uncharacterized protein involved in exopolysaccharide biosynthesis